MLLTVLLTAALMVALAVAMMVGVLMGRQPIKGSCGGVGAQGDCPCGRTPASCGARKDSEAP